MAPRIGEQCGLFERKHGKVEKTSSSKVSPGDAGTVKVWRTDTFSDPTADAALQRLERGADPEQLERQLLALLFFWFKTGAHLLARMQADMQQVAANIEAGRSPTSGLSDAELAAMATKSRATTGDVACLACDDIPARLVAALCPTCHTEWRQSDHRGDPRSFIARKRAQR